MVGQVELERMEAQERRLVEHRLSTRRSLAHGLAGEAEQSSTSSVCLPNTVAVRELVQRPVATTQVRLAEHPSTAEPVAAVAEDMEARGRMEELEDLPVLGLLLAEVVAQRVRPVAMAALRRLRRALHSGVQVVAEARARQQGAVLEARVRSLVAAEAEAEGAMRPTRQVQVVRAEQVQSMSTRGDA